MATYPSTTSASDIWSLRDVYKAEAGDQWPSLGPTDPDFSSVSLLLNFDGQSQGATSFTDLSNSSTNTTGTGSVDTSIYKYGDGSLHVDSANNEYLIAGSNSSFMFGLNDYTVECWARYDGTSNNGIWQENAQNSTFVQRSPDLGLVWYQDKIWSLIDGNGSNTGSPTVSANTWYHLAMVRDGSTTRVFVDGNIIRTESSTGSSNYTHQYFIIGGYYNPSYTMNGYIDDFRVTTGVARYTANFTPPTAKFPTS